MGRILVLAGVNGAGKSSLLGTWLEAEGLGWFNPDSFTRRLVEAGRERGHEVRVIDTLRAYMNITSHKPSIHYKGEELEGFEGSEYY